MSSLRGRRRNSKSPNEKETGLSGKGKKSTDQPQTGRPLEGKVIYLDIQKKSQKIINTLKSDLVDLGATLEPFLSKRITHLFSDRPEANELSRATAYPSGASPAVSTPSPFQQGKGLGAAESPDPSCTARMITRGRAIANKADTSSKTRGSTDVLNNARNMGIPIKCLDKILSYVEREKERMAAAGLVSKQKGDPTGQRSKKKERQLQRYYLKVEDASRRYRPSTKEMDVWPRMVLDNMNTLSPFMERVQSQHNEEPTGQTTQRGADQTEGRKNTPKASKKHVKKAKTTPKQREKGNVRGYCECCQERYSDLDQHIESSGHKFFVMSQTNYTSLDAMIIEGPNMDQFLNDCLQYQNSSQTETPNSLDGVMLISETGEQVNNVQASANHQSASSSMAPVGKPLAQKNTPPRKRSPKSSTPRRKGLTGSNKKRCSSSSPIMPSTAVPPTAEETVGTRLSPRLMSKCPKQIDNSQEKLEQTAGPDEERRKGYHGGDVMDKNSSNMQRETTTQESLAVATIDSSMCARDLDHEQNPPVTGDRSKHTSRERSRLATTDKLSRTTQFTPISPRFRLSLSRRRRRNLLDMSPHCPPAKKRKGLTGVMEGSDLGVTGQEITEMTRDKTRTSPRRRKTSTSEGGQTCNDEVIIVSSPRKKPSSPKLLTNKPRRKQATQETAEDNQVNGEQYMEQNETILSKSNNNKQETEIRRKPTTDVGEGGNRQAKKNCLLHSMQTERPETVVSHTSTREAESQTRHHYVFGSSAPGLKYQRQTVGSVQENRNFPQGTTNTSTGQPFLGHAHTDFGLNPTWTKLPTGHSEITGSDYERLQTIFRSDPVSEDNFEGFSNEEIQETELLYDSFSKPDKVTLKEKLKNAALDVYVPSSEIGVTPAADHKSDSDSESSEGGSLEVDIVLQNVENFPSDGSEWETQVQGFMTKLDTALEIREKQTQRFQEELDRKRVELEEKKAAFEQERSKENQAVADQVVPECGEIVNANSVENLTPVVRTAKTAVNDKEQEREGKRNAAKEVQSLRERVKASTSLEERKEKIPSSDGNAFKSPSKKQALREISNTASPSNRERLPSLLKTPQRCHSQGKRNIPHVTFSPKVTVEDQGIILDHYVHDVSEAEVSFPQLSSPIQKGWRASPIKHFTLCMKGKPTTPTKVARTRRRSCSSSDYSRPLLFLRLKVSPSSRRRSLPNYPDSPPPSPFKSPKHSTPSKKSPPIFALLFDESHRRKGLMTPILVTNRRPNFSREILQPSLRLSVSKRRTRRSSLDKKLPRTLAALNLSLPHIFDVFEFHDEASIDEKEANDGKRTTPAKGGKTAVKTVECGTQTPPRGTRSRTGNSRARVKAHPARRKLCIPTDNDDTVAGNSSRQIILTEPASSVKKMELGTPGTFEGSELARPFDLPMSFYM